MKKTSVILTIGIIILAATAAWGLVVVDESFENYDSGSTLAGQGNWSGPFFQYAGDSFTNGPSIVTYPVSTGDQAGRWQVPSGNDGHFVTVKNTFPVEWTSGTATMYIDVGMDATNGPGNFSYLQMHDSAGNEATRIYLRRSSGTTGDIHLLGRSGGWQSTHPVWLPIVVTDPANNVYYRLKLVIDVTNRRYDCYVGDGDKSGVNVGHWGHYSGSTLVLDGVPAADDLYFYYGATGLASVTWLMYRFGDSFTGSAYALCDNLYIEGPDNAVGLRMTEIWVAKGTYNEKITLRTFAHVYGGFAGNEVSKADRAGLSNPTIIDAGDASPGSAAVTGASIATIDGFTLRGGYYGVNCAGAAPNISNNLILASPGAGVFVSGSSPTVTNNTILGNNTGISASTGSATIANNIIAQNAIGISGGGGSPTLTHNDVYANPSGNYSGVAAGAGDISTDAQFVDQANGDYHLRLGSPCVDTGDPVAAPLQDREGAARPVDGDGDGFAVADIGAHESQTVPPLAEVAGVKLRADEMLLRCEEAVVTAIWPDYFYIESDDRSTGIRVDKPDHGLAGSVRANVSGHVRTDSNGERYIAALAAVANGTGGLEPLGVAGKSVGGSNLLYDPFTGAGQRGVSAFHVVDHQRLDLPMGGLNNIGLLVRAWGTVTWSGGDSFCLDDGSGLDDGDPAVPGVMVTVPLGTTPPSPGSRVLVTGVSSCLADGAELRRLIRARSGADITPL